MISRTNVKMTFRLIIAYLVSGCVHEIGHALGSWIVGGNPVIGIRWSNEFLLCLTTYLRLPYNATYNDYWFAIVMGPLFSAILMSILGIKFREYSLVGLVQFGYIFYEVSQVHYMYFNLPVLIFQWMTILYLIGLCFVMGIIATKTTIFDCIFFSE